MVLLLFLFGFIFFSERLLRTKCDYVTMILHQHQFFHMIDLPAQLLGFLFSNLYLLGNYLDFIWLRVGGNCLESLIGFGQSR